MAGVDQLVTRDVADPDRLGVMGEGGILQGAVGEPRQLSRALTHHLRRNFDWFARWLGQAGARVH